MLATLIAAEQLNANLNNPDYRILDCRFSLHDTQKGRADFEESHIPGALYVHLDEDLSGPIVSGKTGRHPLPSIPEMESLFRRLGIHASTQVVVYDYKSGGIAARLWWMLKYLGHEAVALLNGGWYEWNQQNLPVSQEFNLVSPGEFQARVRPELLKTAAEVEKIRQKEGFALIDSRAPERYLGKEEPIDPVAGHIPGAVNLPFTGNVEEENGRFQPQEELKQRFGIALAGIPPERTVFYCGSGVTACHNILAMTHAGLGMPGLYAGSWSEWITDPERAVARG